MSASEEHLPWAEGTRKLAVSEGFISLKKKKREKVSEV